MTARPTPNRRWLPIVGIGVAAWGALPKIVSPPFDTASLNEVVDHVVPALVVLAVSVWALLGEHGERDERGEVAMFAGGLVIVLAGLWMVSTHLPLVAQAMRHEAPWPATIHHSASAVAVFVFGVIWVAAYWNPSTEEGDVTGPAGSTQAR